MNIKNKKIINNKTMATLKIYFDLLKISSVRKKRVFNIKLQLVSEIKEGNLI